MKRVKVNLGLKGMSVVELIGFALHVILKMTGNILFGTPSPALVKLSNAAAALQNAFNLATGGGPQQTAVMRKAREVMETLLIAEGHYVEDVANDPVNSVTGADAVILNAGMDVKSFQPRKKRVFMVNRGAMSGTVILGAIHVQRGSHEWQYTLDISNPASWVDVDPTIQATTIVSGLESTKKYFFRHRSVLKGGPTAWEGVIDIIVL